MKKLLIPALILAAVILIYEQFQEQPNVYLRAVAIALFMFLLYRLNTKIPHKKDSNNNSEDV
ncbi:hypothetical protein [Flavobacterium sp.]|uniref:hypothetical protein n=1 Tax=Flavobacterium sp. TaxID=239 RepID=UPI0026047DE4|nr:hypothetical protein [Flavobacterium sp.]MDD3003838.1 hypothetical protein [Flavobacterium sp.]